MSSELLPSSVDVVVLGTGLVESVVAAACARSGLSVLHLDRNDYYGGNWASFNLKTMEEWVEKESPSTNGSADQIADDSKTSRPGYETGDVNRFADMLREGERLTPMGQRSTVKNVEQRWHNASEEKSSAVRGKDSEPVTSSHRELLSTEWRRFSFDLAPKALLARGPMVQTLCDSEVAKYAEFKCIDRFMCLETADGASARYSRVPCSKGEIFENGILEMMDKRRLMKFFMYCHKWSSDSDNMEDWKAFESRPFAEFLSSHGIKNHLLLYISDAIGILHPNANTKEGLAAVCRFVDSVGRFGPSPFLFPLYGCGELPQCFCRLAAVFGGLYCLGRPISAVIRDDEKILAVIADGQRVDVKHVVMASEFVPDEMTSSSSSGDAGGSADEWIDHSMHITAESIWKENDDKEHVSLVNLSQLDPVAACRLFEVGHEVCSAPKGYYVVHVTGRGEKSTEAVEQKLTEMAAIPPPLWSMRFSALSSIAVSNLPENAAVVKGADNSLDYSAAIEEAQRVFSSFWPDRDFLPRSLKTDDDEVPDEMAEMQPQSE